MQQMGGRMVAHNIAAALSINLRLHPRTDPDRSLLDHSVVNDQPRHRALRIDNACKAIASCDQPCIANLTSALGVEWCAIEDKLETLSCAGLTHCITINNQCQHTTDIG